MHCYLVRDPSADSGSIFGALLRRGYGFLVCATTPVPESSARSLIDEATIVVVVQAGATPDPEVTRAVAIATSLGKPTFALIDVALGEVPVSLRELPTARIVLRDERAIEAALDRLLPPRPG